MKNMKRLLCLALSLAMSVTVMAGCSNSSSSSSSAPSSSSDAASDSSDASSSEAVAFTTIEDGKLIMATNAQFPPYELVSDGAGYENTGFEGIDVELAYALAQKLGLELVIDDMDFNGALIAVQENLCDVVLAGLTYREDRDQVMDFTDSYSTGIQVVIVPEDSDIATLDDMTGKKIGAQLATTGYIFTTDDFGEEYVTAYDDGATAVQALLSGQIDCVVIDNAPAQEYVKANPALKILDTEYAVEDYCIAVDEGNDALKDALNKALDELKADGTLDAIVAKYIPAE